MQEKKLNKAVSDVKLMKTPEGKTEVKNAVKDATKRLFGPLWCCGRSTRRLRA